MSLKLYDLVGADDRRFSPYCWRVRMALAHKGLAAELVPTCFTDKDKIAFSKQDKVPVLMDGETVVSDSFEIACYLEDAYPDRPSLFGGALGRAEARFINHWVITTVHGPLLRMVIKDILDHLDPKDRAYFRDSRTKRLGAPLEEIQAGREARLPEFRAGLAPFRALLAEQPYMCGEAPAFGDYILFGAFQWARVISPFHLLERDDPVHAWRRRMLGLFDGLAEGATGYAETAA